MGACSGLPGACITRYQWVKLSLVHFGFPGDISKYWKAAIMNCLSELVHMKKTKFFNSKAITGNIITSRVEYLIWDDAKQWFSWNVIAAAAESNIYLFFFGGGIYAIYHWKTRTEFKKKIHSRQGEGYISFWTSSVSKYWMCTLWYHDEQTITNEQNTLPNF